MGPEILPLKASLQKIWGMDKKAARKVELLPKHMQMIRERKRKR
jgi:hypothetical protein